MISEMGGDAFDLLSNDGGDLIFRKRIKDDLFVYMVDEFWLEVFMYSIYYMFVFSFFWSFVGVEYILIIDVWRYDENSVFEVD